MTHKIPKLLALAVAWSSVIARLCADTLLFTEYSSTVLTATVNGVPYGNVNNSAPGTWLWWPPNSPFPWTTLLTMNEAAWAESSGSPSVNVVTPSIWATSYFFLTIRSDVPPPNATPILDNGSVLPSGLTLNAAWNWKYGNEPSWSKTYDLRYLDLTATVPDQTASVLLLLLAGIALVGVKIVASRNHPTLSKLA